jgi:uncharacterized protein
MKNLLRAMAVVLCLSSLATSAQSADTAQPTEMKSFVIGLLYKGSAWKPATTDEGRQLQSAHRANIARLVDAGSMAAAGPVDSNDDLRGIFIFNVDTVEKAQALIATDPAVRANQLRFQLYVWYGPVAIETVTIRSKGANK